MGKETQSEFIQNMDETTKSLQQIVTNSWAQGIILLGAETILGEDGKEKNNSIISTIGHSKEIIAALVEFMNNPQTKPLFEDAKRLQIRELQMRKRIKKIKNHGK